jgi:hypothetical protein
MRTKVTIMTFCILLGSSGLAQVKHGIQAATTGNALLDCLNIETPYAPDTPTVTIYDSFFCQGYVLGVFQAIAGANKNGIGIDGVNPPLACPGPGVTMRQIMDVIKNYLYAHPVCTSGVEGQEFFPSDSGCFARSFPMLNLASTTGYTAAMKRRGGASLLKLGSVVQLYDSVLRGSHYVRQLSHSGGLLSPHPAPGRRSMFVRCLLSAGF